MLNNQGFLLINIYAFLVIFATSIIFFSKERMKQIEDELYKNLLIVNIFLSISGLLLGFIVSSSLPFDDLTISIFNKFYLVSLSLWIYTFTFYIIYVSQEDKLDIKTFKKLFNILFIFSPLIIIFLPINVEINSSGSAIASGLSVLFTYSMFALGFLIQIFCVFSNYKNLKNKKFIPLYLLIFFAIVILLALIVNPALNYIINPTLIFITFIMYFTIENPDAKILKEVHNAKVISDNANEEKTLFLYNMTNEIRNTTRNIDNEVNDILDSNSLENDKIYARNIKLETSKFKLMTNEILDISALDTASIKIYNEKYNIKTLLKEIIITYKDKVKGLDFRTNIASDIPEILYGDSLSIKNVLISLLDNSIKYTKRGYIELNVNMIKKQDVARLIISVEDSGIGIKSNELNQIFNKNKEKIDKYNLKNNLYTANKVTTLMGGTLLVSSTYGKGTVVKMILDQKIEVIDNKYDKVYDQKRILLVEDSEVTVKLINKMLKNTNITLDTVDLGSKAIEKIRNKEKYDLILLEEELKPLDAYQIIKKLKNIRNFNTKVILITKNKTLEYSDQLNFDKILIKPIDKEQLLNKIDEYL